MALPDHVLSSVTLESDILSPRDRFKEPLVAYDYGGIAIQDPSQGLKVQIWRGEVVGNEVIFSAPSVDPTVIFEQAGITELDITFDQNMQPFAAYMLDGLYARFRWYDATVPGFTITELPAGSYSPRCTLDDKRSASGTIPGLSDIILTYLRGDKLYFREQSDRYEVEYELKDELEDKVISKFGMNRKWRMQWVLSGVLPYPVPEITAISPSSIVEGSSGFTMTIDGRLFVEGSIVRWGGVDQTTIFVSKTRLQIVVPAEYVDTDGTVDVTVVNPLPGGGESDPVTFTIQNLNPLPAISSIDPDNAVEDSGALTLTVTGSGFVPSSVVRWAGSARTTTYISDTELEADILSTDVDASGTFAVTVVSPSPGGGESNSVDFVVAEPNPVPVLSSLDPSDVDEDTGAFTLTLTGSDFIPSSVVRWGGADRMTTYVSGTELQAAILATDIEDPGSVNVTVFNPAPVGGESDPLEFTINDTDPLPMDEHWDDVVLLIDASKHSRYKDPFWDETVVLLLFNGADGSTTMTDETGRAWTANGNAQLDTAEKKFGESSLQLDGTGDWISTPSASALQFATGAVPFTMEIWARALDAGTNTMINKRDASSAEEYGWSVSTASAWDLFGSGSSRVNLNSNSGTPGGVTVPVETWHHHAVSFDGTTYRMFIDGVLVDTDTHTNGTTNSEPLKIGRDGFNTGRDFNGNIDSVRITRGAARYKASFTAPTEAFPVGDIDPHWSNVVLLIDGGKPQ